ncbi:putative aspartic-type endopeptidase [Emericellopsis atlantica]|uniref:Aspartic-type endopeptidase n=1 Tax=Emericellopsis atlantica TaxID=2614577 RepID=A0A9P7ZHY2_9HYPO|nr:putative aspartic-type endopeptidase [Emericellopsis atlantica]KAG9252439.1 putative aspartic-type endopeptidase [Emericellopsis atlantica]
MRAKTLIAVTATIGAASGIVAPLHRRTGNSTSHAQDNPAPLIATLNSFWFDVEVQIGNQTFYLLVDTGSSDTWVAADGYTCIDPADNRVLPSEECMWSPTYTVPQSMRYIQNQTFGVKYGTGVALGKLGIESVTVGGITVQEQAIGIVDRATDKGDGVNSGILGLGFPMLTSAHPGTVLENDTMSLITNRIPYEPTFVNMYKKGLVESWYSIAINRLPRDVASGMGGWLGLGELPPVEHTDDWAVAPIEITEGIPDEFYPGGKPVISLMTLTVDGASWGSSSPYTTNTTKLQAVVDSGNNMNLVPIEIAESVNGLFEPPATFKQDLDIYVVDCHAKPPSFGVTIDGHTFWHDPEDMISKDNTTGLCYSTLGNSADGLGTQMSFLGDAFMKNVVSVFDFGKTEMRFAARTENAQTTASPLPTPSALSASPPSFACQGIWLWVLLALMAQALLA